MSEPLRFTTDKVAPEQRLAVFQAGAVDYLVDAIGDPLAFGVQWDLAVLNEVNIIEARITPVHYRRTAEMIERGGNDRVSVLFVTGGRAQGLIDERPVDIGPGEAMVFDLLRTIDIRCPAATDYRIITMPRHLIEEVLPNAHFNGRIAASDRLSLVYEQIGLLLAAAGTLPPHSVVFQVRALRNLLAVALLPAYHPLRVGDPDAPLFRRIIEEIDRDIAREHDAATLGAALDEAADAVSAVLERFGGLARLLERRRLLRAYRRLSDPTGQAQVSTIALESGFANRAEFGRRFRAVFQCAPRDVKMQHPGQLPLWAGAYHVAQNYGPLLA